MTARPASGIVLAGGRATRYGSDKLAERIGGVALLDRAVGAVAACCSEVIVVAAAGATEPALAPTRAHVRVRHDSVPDGGPLVGLAAGLGAAIHPVVLVAAGDMPDLVPEVLRALMARVAAGAPGAALLEGDRLRPLPCALDRGRAAASLAAVRAAGRSSVLALLEALDAQRVREADWRPLDPEGRTLLDVDRPDDLRRAGGGFRPSGGGP